MVGKLCWVVFQVVLDLESPVVLVRYQMKEGLSACRLIHTLIQLCQWIQCSLLELIFSLTSQLTSRYWPYCFGEKELDTFNLTNSTFSCVCSLWGELMRHTGRYLASDSAAIANYNYLIGHLEVWSTYCKSPKYVTTKQTTGQNCISPWWQCNIGGN